VIIKRKQEEIDEVLNKCADAMDHGSMFHGMSYEEGIHQAIQWLLGHYEENPMDDYVYHNER
jgi:hypothetical protein